MGKLIGTGKDVRMPKGVDYDVRDEDVEAHAKLGLGDPVDPETEMERIHPGEKQIVAEGGPPEVAGDGGQDGPAEGERGGDVAARVESTSAEGQAAGGGGGGSDEDLSKLSRDELNARAAEAGVEDPESLPNKPAVVDAIKKAEAGAE